MASAPSKPRRPLGMAGIAMMVANIADDKAIAERRAAEIREKEAERKKKDEEERKAAEKERLAKEKMERVKKGIEDEKKRRREEEKKKQMERAKRAKKAVGAGSLYGNLPEADPEKDEAARKRAEELEKPTLKLKPLPPPDSTKVVFLDIDGVLRPMVRGGYQAMMVDGEYAMKADTSDFMSTAMLALRHIIECTGAVVVVSSEWRRDKIMREAVDQILQEYEMPVTVSWTRTDIPRAMGTENPFAAFVERRAREISDWLRQNPGTKHWVVLDDINMSMADTDPQRLVGTHRMTERTVQTHNQIGLTMANAKAAVQIIRGEKIPPQILEVQPNMGLC